MAEKVLVAMSGGVDSSVAAYLLQQQGYACIGVTMRLYENETAGIPRGHTCCSLDDVEDARAVAYDLGMPYYVLNFTEEFDEKVIRKFVQVYQNGGTPNPCIDCNRYLKFDHLLNRARELGCDYIATGHYVQRWQDENGRWGLRKNDDPGKDQSYVLYSLTQDQLAHTLFPLGGMHKDAVRAIAEEQGLCNARKHDSQDICFVPDGDYAAFLERYTGQPMQPGQLAAALDQIGARGFNMECIKSRPLPHVPFEYYFYVQIVCPAGSTGAGCQTLLDTLTSVCSTLRLLGAFTLDSTEK